METVKESSESMERDDEPFPSVTVSMSPPSVPFSLLTSSEARARGAVERDPKDEPRSGEDKGRVTRGLGVMGERDASCHLLSYRYATPTGRMTETNEGMNRDKECKKRGNERMNGM